MANYTFNYDLVVKGGLAATGAITGSNLSGTNTGDQNLAPYALITDQRFSTSTPAGYDVADTTTTHAAGLGAAAVVSGVGAGGAMLFGVGPINFAYIKGYFTNGTTNGIGKLVIGTRTLITDTSMTNKVIIHEPGDVEITSGSLTVADSFTLNCTNSTDALVVNRPGSSPAGSFVSLSSPGGIPGIIGVNSGTTRTDLKFDSGGSFSIAVSASMTGAASQYTFDSSGNFASSGNATCAAHIATSNLFTGSATGNCTYAANVGSLVFRPNNFVTTTGQMVLATTGNLTVAGSVTSNGDELGFRKVPITAQNANYTAVADDSGRCRSKTGTGAWTYTINNAVFAGGEVLTIVNNAASGNVVIAAGSGVTLRLAGTTTTGSRTVAPFGIATIYMQSATVGLVSGPGVT